MEGGGIKPMSKTIWTVPKFLDIFAKNVVQNVQKLVGGVKGTLDNVQN